MNLPLSIPFSGISILLSGIFLSYFAFRRFLDFKEDPENTTNNFYLLASTLVSIAMVLYGLPAFFYNQYPETLSFSAVFSTILNVTGFGYFLKIPLFIWLSRRKFSIASHLISIYVLLIASLLIASPPPSFLDIAGIIHWKFSTLQSALILFFNAGAFGLNIIVLGKNFKLSNNFEGFLKLGAILLTFILTGLGGSYLYFGDDSELLLISNIFLLVGILSVVIGSYSLRETVNNEERTDI